MFIIGAEKLGVAFGEKVLLENVSFSVNQGEKISIVGVNGAGKSTLLRLFCHRDLPFTGNLFISRGKTIGHLEQQSRLDPEKSVYEAALSVFSALQEEEEKLEKWSEKLKVDPSDDNIARFTSLQQHFERSGGYEYKSRARGTLIHMGFSEEKLSLKVSALSGGQKTILQLALLLLEEPDILLLDEPTNHLDIQSLEWLEDTLRRIRSTILVISHDRLFLDRVTEKTLEIENTHAKLYPVPYSQYREMKEKDREIRERHYKNQQKEIARIEAFIAQQKRWNRERNIIAAESRQKALDRMVKVDRVEALPDALSFHFSTALESGNDVLSVKKLSKSYREPLFQELSFEVKKKDRLLIVGPNGCGKSTLLQILAGNLSPDSGSFQYGYNVRLGYYDQYQRLNESNTVLEEIWQDSDCNHTQIRSLLATFLFKGDDVYKEIRLLSGGEKARLVLAKLMQKKVNLLLLDEPTNHLDIESKEALEKAILQFEGTVIAISHDRYFIQKIASRILRFSGDGKIFLDDKISSFNQDHRESAVQKEQSVSTSLAENQGENNYLQQKKKKQDERRRQNRLQKIEEELETAEKRIHEIDEEIPSVSTDYVALQKLYEEKESLQEKCDLLLEEWDRLENELT